MYNAHSRFKVDSCECDKPDWMCIRCALRPSTHLEATSLVVHGLHTSHTTCKWCANDNYWHFCIHSYSHIKDSVCIELLGVLEHL